MYLRGEDCGNLFSGLFGLTFWRYVVFFFSEYLIYHTLLIIAELYRKLILSCDSFSSRHRWAIPETKRLQPLCSHSCGQLFILPISVLLYKSKILITSFPRLPKAFCSQEDWLEHKVINQHDYICSSRKKPQRGVPWRSLPSLQNNDSCSSYPSGNFGPDWQRKNEVSRQRTQQYSKPRIVSLRTRLLTVKIIWKYVPCLPHPQRPRGSQLGQEKRHDKIFLAFFLQTLKTFRGSPEGSTC